QRTPLGALPRTRVRASSAATVKRRDQDPCTGAEARKGCGVRAVTTMAEHRPYRVTSRSAKAQLLRVKLVSLTLFWVAALAINWRATQLAARTFGDAPQLAPTLLGFYAPWEWIVWWSRWYQAERLRPVWGLCVIRVALPLLVAFAVTVGAIN